MAKKKKKAVRVALGTPEAPFAPAWKIWAHNNDVYLATRDSNGISKISLHPDCWLFAFTKESAITAVHGDRNLGKWQPPREFAEDWTLGPIIYTPRIDDTYDLPPFTWLNGVRWIAAPPAGAVSCLLVCLSRTADTPDSVVTEAHDVLGSLTLRDGRTAWVLHIERPMTVDELARWTEEREKFVIHLKRGARVSAGELSATPLLCFDPVGDGPPTFL